MKKSWKTTVTGIATIVVAIGTAVIAQFDDNVSTEPNWGAVVAGLTAGAGLIAARDNTVTSEQAGAK